MTPQKGAKIIPFSPTKLFTLLYKLWICFESVTSSITPCKRALHWFCKFSFPSLVKQVAITRKPIWSRQIAVILPKPESQPVIMTYLLPRSPTLALGRINLRRNRSVNIVMSKVGIRRYKGSMMIAVVVFETIMILGSVSLYLCEQKWSMTINFCTSLPSGDILLQSLYNAIAKLSVKFYAFPRKIESKNTNYVILQKLCLSPKMSKTPAT